MKHNDIYRKKPSQARAQNTVSAILEAAARLLQARGDKGLTTNAIAQKAGVSIGTLYQYFPNKRSIMVVLARKELSETSLAVKAPALALPGQPTAGADPIRVRIHALLTGFQGRLRTRKALVEMLIANGLGEELTRPVENIMQGILQTQPRELAQDGQVIKPVTAYVLTRAVIGCVRAALMENSPYLGTVELEDELVKLVRGYLAAQ